MQLTIYFDAPYWTGVLEHERDGRLYVVRHIFGAEPGDAELYEFVQRDLLRLMETMTVGLPVMAQADRRKNPKRVQREVRQAAQETGLSTRAQEAMRLQIEAGKKARQQQSRASRQALKDHRRERAAEKAKAKHKGH